MNIWGFIKRNLGSIISILVVLLLVVGIYKYINLKKNYDSSKYNIEVMQDSVRQVRLKNGELLSMRESYILKEKELSDYLELSNKEVKDLKKKLGSSLSEIAKLKGSVTIDTVITYVSKDSIIYRSDSSISARFKYDDKWLQFKGSFDIDPDTSKVSIYDVNIPIDATVGWTKKGKFFISSPNPYVKFNNINSATIKPSSISKWHVGFQGGVYVIYDAKSKKAKAGPGIGFGISRSF